MSVHLGRLERVELRYVWASESSDFTPWLARPENIAILSETIGIELEVEAQEKEVGPFRADILCKDTSAEDKWVLIENQLERTDHSHLGQLLTYAAGLQTVTIVWIAQRFTDEHRAALDWLNEITDGRFNFFGLEIELWRIGESPIAPKFNVVCQPNDWTNSVTSGKHIIETGELTESKQLQLEYWTQFHELLRSTGSHIKGTKPLPQNWNNWAIGRSEFYMETICNMRDGWVAVTLLMKGPHAQDYFQQFETRKLEIESLIGTPLIWHAPESNKQLKLIAKHSGAVDERSAWGELQEWQRKMLELFYRVFRPIVMEMQAVVTGEDS